MVGILGPSDPMDEWIFNFAYFEAVYLQPLYDWQYQSETTVLFTASVWNHCTVTRGEEKYT